MLVFVPISVEPLVNDDRSAKAVRVSVQRLLAFATDGRQGDSKWIARSWWVEG